MAGAAVASLLASAPVLAARDWAQATGFAEAAPVNLRYGSERTQTAGFWPGAGASAAPLVLLVTDGGWRTRMDFDRRGLAETLAMSGMAVAVARHRPDRPTEVRAMMADICTLLQHMAATAARRKLRTDRIAIIGFSAGAAPAALLATNLSDDACPILQGSALKALILVDPLGLDPEATLQAARPDVRPQIEAALGRNPADRRRNALATYLAPPNVPAAFVLGNKNDRRDLDAAAAAAGQMKANGIDAQFLPIPLDHIGDSSTNFGSRDNPTTQALVRYLWQRLR
jgi:acetyl esterase/lipase